MKLPINIFLVQVAVLLLVFGCQTPDPTIQTDVDTSGNTIVGHWEGKAPDGMQIEYVFDANGRCIWSLEGQESIYCRYEIDQTIQPIQIDIFDFSISRLKEVRFLGIIEIERDSLKLLGIPTKDGFTADGKIAAYPKGFTEQTIQFARVDNK